MFEHGEKTLNLKSQIAKIEERNARLDLTVAYEKGCLEDSKSKFPIWLAWIVNIFL